MEEVVKVGVSVQVDKEVARVGVSVHKIIRVEGICAGGS